MIDNMWFDTLQQPFCKNEFFMKIVTDVTVTGVTFLMGNASNTSDSVKNCSMETDSGDPKAGFI